MKHFLSGLSVLACLASLSACKGETEVIETIVNTPKPIDFEEAVPQKPDYCRAVVTYYGCYDGESDLSILNLYTTADTTAEGEAAGAYEMLQLAIFTPVSYVTTVGDDGKPVYTSQVSLDSLLGTFNVPDALWGAYSFLPGMMTTTDSPKGYVQVAEYTLYGNYVDGKIQGTEDLLSEGAFTIAQLDGDQYAIEGMLVGNEFAKRYFSYSGKLEVKIADETSPNTNLTGDLALPQFPQGCLIDDGDCYRLGDNSYRKFVVYLATEGMELREDYPAGDGELLALDLFVPWQASDKSGIPTGTYSMTPMYPNGGIERKDIVPYRIVPGTPNRYTFYQGSWYRHTVNGELVDYARITDGTMRVDRTLAGGYEIEFDLQDAKNHKIAGHWSSKNQLTTFDHGDTPLPDIPEEDNDRPVVTTYDSIWYKTSSLPDEEMSQVRATFVDEADGMVSLYLTPADITYAAELETAFYYCRLTFDPAEADGSVVTIENQSGKTFEIEAYNNYSQTSDATSSAALNGAKGRFKVRKTSDSGNFYEVFIDVTFANGNNIYASYTGLFNDAEEVAPEEPNQFHYAGETYAIASAILDQRDPDNNHIYLCSQPEVTTLEAMAQANPVCVTLPESKLGDLIGFSSCPTASMSYDGHTWSGSNKYDSGTIETHLNGNVLYVTFINYAGFDGKYKGQVTVIK